MTVLMLSVLSKVDEKLFVQIECLSIGLTAFISCLLTQYAVKSMQEAKKESVKRFGRAFVIMIAVFILSCGKSVYNILWHKRNNPVIWTFNGCKFLELHFLEYFIHIADLT